LPETDQETIDHKAPATEAYSRSKGVQSVSDKDADAKNDKKCCKSFKHGDPNGLLK
jgi:hypothetical protein